MLRLPANALTLKLLAWFLAVYMLIAAGTVLSISTAQNIRQSVDAFDRSVLPGTLLLAKTATTIHQTVDDSHTLPTKNMRPNAPADVQARARQQNLLKVQADLEEIQGYIRDYNALDLPLSDRALLLELTNAFDAFQEIDNRMTPHMLIGTDEEVAIGRAIGTNELGPAFDRLDRVVGALLALEEQQAHAGAAQAMEAENFARNALVAVLVVVFGMVVAVGLYVGRSITRQITERERQEEALRVRDRAMSATPTAIAISDVRLPDHPVVYVNPAFERVTGYSAGDIQGQRLKILAGRDTDPRVGEQILAAFSEHREALIEATHYRKDGSPYASELALAPVRDGDGNVTHYIWLISDLTERKRNEAQARALAESEKLRAVGQMASGIAHDLNQSLMLIASYSDLSRQALEKEHVDREELGEMFTVVRQAALDGGDTLKRLLRFARAPIEDANTPLDLTLLAREVAQLTAPRWRDAAQAEGRPIKLDVETKGHPIVLGAPALLRDAITNLVMNAVDALPNGGAIQLRVYEFEQRAVLEVADDGIGMSDEVKSRVFEPFFTTKGDKGTGLGLATLFALVERLGGQVTVDSKPDQGTTFRLEFPQVSGGVGAQALPQVSVPAASAQTRQMRILAVDDEPALTKAVVRLLRPRGHVVVAASSGEDALARMAEEPFDLVLSDVGMGEGMNGWELAERVRGRWPNVRFVLATGWGAAIDPDEARQKGVEAVLSKPYSAEELDAILSQAA